MNGKCSHRNKVANILVVGQLKRKVIYNQEIVIYWELGV